MRDATFVVPSVVNIRSMDCRSPANKISIDSPVPHMVDFGEGLKLAVPKRSPGVTVCMQVDKPVPVALHWREKVKADFDADVKGGVLEKVSAGVPCIAAMKK